MLNGNTNPKLQGVVPIGSTAEKTAPARTVTHCTPMQMFAIEMGDEAGVKHTTVVFKAGNQFYHDPQGEDWARRLRPIDSKTWLARQLLDAATTADGGRAEVPRQDSVDVMGGG